MTKHFFLPLFAAALIAGPASAFTALPDLATPTAEPQIAPAPLGEIKAPEHLLLPAPEPGWITPDKIVTPAAFLA
ncbi:MAG: hypothetical protein AAF748_04830 [Pseudomonadota bacterium]